MPDPLDLCALCGETTEHEPWIVLNRWIVGTGAGHAMVEAVDDEGEYLWEMDDPEHDVATGRALHWPGCANRWIEMKMIEVDVELRT